MKLVHIAALAVAGLAVAAFAGVFQPSGARSAQTADTSSGGITVTGDGSVTVVPDQAGFSFGTMSQADTAAAALAESSKAVAKVVDALKRAGVAKADIQTSEVSLSPRMNNAGTQITGYTASNTVSVTVRKLADAGGIVDAAVGAGANQVYGPNLVVSEQDAAYRTALKAAVAQARAKAETLASAAGRSLGAITAISEGGSTPVPLPAMGATKDSAVPIEPGTQKVEATVSVTFAFG
jgi:uncharacterized protein YggE